VSAMRVIEVARFGGPEVLTPASVPDPVAGAGEVVIDVAAADVLFLDTLIRSGRAARFFPVRPPYVPGNGVAGVVSSIGDGVGSGLLGQRVIAHTGQAGGTGGYTERATVPADQVVQVPDGVDPSDAAAVLHDGVTALAITERIRLDAGDQVLILGAAGGMGIILMQLARAAGARVIAAARGAAKLHVLADRGADLVVDYSEPGWAARVVQAAGGGGPQVVLDGAGGQLGRAAFEITAPGGRFSAHGSASGSFALIDPEEARRRDISVLGLDQVRFSDEERVRLAGRVLAELAAGRIRPYIGQTFPLEKAADAHAGMETRTAIGKTLLALQ
jgi:NADPH2:quinone reductase